MKNKILIIMVLISLYACKKAPLLTNKGMGEIQFGERLSTVESRLKQKMSAPPPDEAACYYVAFAAYPQVKWMVNDGLIVRADVDANIDNDLHLRIGDAIADIQKRYPQVEISPHAYVETGFYYVFKSADKKGAIVLETDAKQITAIRAGLEPAVEYVEGCY